MEPRGFEPLTSCLQIGLIIRGNGRDLDEGQSASDLEYRLLTALNGPLMARRLSPPRGGQVPTSATYGLHAEVRDQPGAGPPPPQAQCCNGSQ
ncbi:hypothetical protein Msi02_84730 [Microbispora siamensis]|uniref:Uncharacterized protein n=1 Tax=Microbispora siamensis TaxID=564413 RepID=A0ABQ4H1V1_9ACTN|nr:hypothetical protein Msi02_84730 [Microbispora siamensis]